MIKRLMYGFFFCSAFNAVALEPIEVDTELQLLLDVSGSVNSQEYDLQLQGYANAFSNTETKQVIDSGPLGSIAVQLIMWSGASQQQIMIDWMHIDTPDDADTLSSLIANIARPFGGWTGYRKCYQLRRSTV